MGFLDRLLGRPDDRDQRGYRPPGPPAYEPTPGYTPAAAPATGRAGSGDADQRAIARYRYLLRTAPPETIEKAHAEAFAQLTPEQRRQVLSELGQDLPASERTSSDDPQSLARMATRAEMRQPGTLERAFGGSRMGGFGMGGGMGGGMGRGLGGGMGMGGMIAGTLLGSIAGTVIGSSIASAFLDDNYGGDQEAGDSGDSSDSGDSGDSSDSGDAAGVADPSGGDSSVDTAGDLGGGGYAGEYGGGYGGDYGGGGDFGGGDFGGGDF